MNLATLRPPGAPALGDPNDYGPGPLSPAWPHTKPIEPPATEWEALARELAALRTTAIETLIPEPRFPFFLGLGERERIEAAIAQLRHANAQLPHTIRSSELARWPVPALPPALFGARDLAAILSIAIRCAWTLNERELFARAAQDFAAHTRSIA